MAGHYDCEVRSLGVGPCVTGYAQTMCVGKDPEEGTTMAKSNFVPASFTIGELVPKESARVHFTIIRSEADQRRITRDLGLFTEYKSRRNKR